MSGLRIGLVAGEVSGDILGADLMQHMLALHPDIEFVGVGGERMIGQGLISLYPMDPLSVMGLLEPLKKLPELLRMRRELAARLSTYPIDVFIGIDAPDFNLGLAKRLKKKGIATVHYVSPSVWAWRQGRIKTIQKSIDLMLALLPFEADFYRQHHVPVCFVGHPLARQIKAQPDKLDARGELSLSATAKTLALLPGSRTGEIKYLMPVYLEAIDQIHLRNPDIHFVFAAVNKVKAEQIRSYIGERQIPIVVGKTLRVIAAADLVIAASGTTTLEIMLVNRPLIVAYRADRLSYGIISRMVKVPYVSLPNLIAGKGVVDEFLQDDATPANLAAAVEEMISDPQKGGQQSMIFSELAGQLNLPSSEIAAGAILDLLKKSKH